MRLRLDPTGAVSVLVADAVGNLLSVTDALGNQRTYQYNRDGRVVGMSDEEGNREDYEYNTRKDLVGVRDVLGNTTRFSYDRRHLLVKVENPLGERVEYGYRDDGRMVEKVIEGRNHTLYRDDARGNLIERAQVETGVSVGYQYDSVGRVSGVN